MGEGDPSKSGWRRVLPGSHQGSDSRVSLGALPRTPWVHLSDASTATTFHQIYAPSHLETRSFFLDHRPQDHCSYTHSPRCRGGAAWSQASRRSGVYHPNPWHALPGESGNGQVCREKRQDFRKHTRYLWSHRRTSKLEPRARTIGRMQE